MHRTRIKFCGITRPQDAIAAANAGADAIGLIFYAQSPRSVSVDQARDILRSLPPMVLPIGLFVNSPTDQVRQTAQILNIGTVQLHGDETPDEIAELADFKIIKAIRCEAGNLRSILQTWRDASFRLKNLAGILLETASTKALGGTGIENDWTAIELASNSQKSLPPLIVAGGLTPDNVGAVVRKIKPWAVDVSTGIEESRGMKSVDKMNRFASEVRLADRHGD